MIKYECDRCGVQQRVKEAPTMGNPRAFPMPRGWHRLAVPPVVPARSGSKDLCGECVNALTQFLHRLPGEPAANRRCGNCGHIRHDDAVCHEMLSRNGQAVPCPCAEELAELVAEAPPCDAPEADMRADPAANGDRVVCKVCGRDVDWDLPSWSWKHCQPLAEAASYQPHTPAPA